MSLPRYAEYKESEVEWLGAVPSHWRVDRLKASIESARNGIWGEEPKGDTDDIACVRVADFDRIGLKVKAPIPTVRSIIEKERAGRLLRKGDLLLEKSGGGELQPVGQVVMYQLDTPAVCSNFVARVALASGMSAGFWNYVHSAAYSVGVNVGAINQTSGIQNLDQDRYFNERAPFPPFNEQAAIATFLDHETAKIDALIAEQEKLIALLAEKRQATISHAVTRGLNPDAPMKDSGVAWLGEVPGHWEVGAVKRFFSSLDGRRVPLSAEERSDRKGEFPYYGASGVIDTIDDYIYDEDLVLVSEDGANLLNRSSPIAFIATGKYWVNNHAHILRPVDENLRFWAERIEAIDLSPVVTGSAQPKLTIDALMNLPISTPPTREERAAIGQFIDTETTRLDTLRAESERAITLLKERRAALIAAAVTGQIDVRDAVAEATI